MCDGQWGGLILEGGQQWGASRISAGSPVVCDVYQWSPMWLNTEVKRNERRLTITKLVADRRSNSTQAEKKRISRFNVDKRFNDTKDHYQIYHHQIRKGHKSNN